MHSEFLDYDNKGKLEYIKLGNSGLPLLFLPGATAIFEVYEAFLNELSKSFTVYAINMPGLGRSSYREMNNIHDYTDIINIFITQMNINKFIIAGHSLGAQIALAYSYKYGDKLKGLVGVAINTKPLDKNIFQLADGIRTDNEDKLVYKNTIGMLNGIKQKINNFKSILDEYLFLRNFNVENLMTNIKVKSLMIISKNDRIINPQYQRLTKNIPDSKLIEIEGGHNIIISKANLIASEITKYFNQQNS
jgi:pimeloyl-ACP methyl ester carboxylesterase